MSMQSLGALFTEASPGPAFSLVHALRRLQLGARVGQQSAEDGVKVLAEPNNQGSPILGIQKTT